VVKRVLVFDIETLGVLGERERAAIEPLALRRESTPEEYASLCPPLARVATVAWYDVETAALTVALDASLAPPGEIATRLEVRDPVAGQPARSCVVRSCAGEAELLATVGAAFEEHCGPGDAWLVSYNGRGFDLPVLLHRGAVLGVEPGRATWLRAMRDNRNTPSAHVDLMDVFTFCGAGGRWPLAAYAIGYGAESPKAEMDGSQVGAAIRSGRIVEVARYCATDVLTTAYLYNRTLPLIRT